MSQELLQLLERRRELAAAEEMVDAFLGTQLDRRVRQNLARAVADGYRAEGVSLAQRLATAKLRVTLMDKYGDGWPDCAEWKAYIATRRWREL